MTKSKNKIATTSVASAIAATAAHAAANPAPVVVVEVQAAPAAVEQPSGTATITTVVGVTKASKARMIFDDAYSQTPVPQRKEIIGRMVREANLTPAGAATYLQNMKSKAGLVNKRTPAAA